METVQPPEILPMAGTNWKGGYIHQYICFLPIQVFLKTYTMGGNITFCIPFPETFLVGTHRLLSLIQIIGLIQILKRWVYDDAR